MDMQKIEKVKLKSGLEVNFLFDKDFKTSSLEICFKIGWRNDTESERGLAHLFEHLVGKRTKKYQGKSEFAIKLDEEGITSNAWTGPDTTGYWQNQTNKQLLPSLELLFEAIYNSHFMEEDLQKEKEIVLNEAKQYLDNDQSILWRQTLLNLYPKTSMEKFFFGDKKTLSNINLKHFEDFYNVYKNPENSILFVGTNNPKIKSKILKFLNDFYTKPETKKLLSKTKIERFKDLPGEIKKYSQISKPDRELASINIGYKTAKLNKKETVVAGVIISMLVGGLTGKMMQVLRDEMGLTYSISMFAGDFHQAINFLGFSTSCEKSKKDLVIQTIKQVLENFPKNLIEKDIKRVIPQKEYQEQKPVSVYDEVSRLIDSVIYKNEYIQTQEYLKILNRVNVNDVRKLMKKTFLEENSSVCVLE